MKGLDKQIEENCVLCQQEPCICRELHRIYFGAHSGSYHENQFSVEVGRVIAQAVQEALAKQRKEIELAVYEEMKNMVGTVSSAQKAAILRRDNKILGVIKDSTKGGE